jgi:hypothetical protein
MYTKQVNLALAQIDLYGNQGELPGEC